MKLKQTWDHRRVAWSAWWVDICRRTSKPGHTVTNPLTSAVFVLIKARCRENDCREERRGGHGQTNTRMHTRMHTHTAGHNEQPLGRRGVRTCRNSTKEWEIEMSSQTSAEGFCSVLVQELRNFLKEKQKRFWWFGPTGSRRPRRNPQNRKVERGDMWSRTSNMSFFLTSFFVFESIHQLQGESSDAGWLRWITSIWTHLGFRMSESHHRLLRAQLHPDQHKRMCTNVYRCLRMRWC